MSQSPASAVPVPVPAAPPNPLAAPWARTAAALGPRRLWLIGGVAAAMLGAMAWLATSGPGDMGYLYTDLAPGEARSITEQLTQTGTPFELSADGTAIMAPRARLAELRMGLADEALGGPLGYAILDAQPAFGLSAARERLDATRAIEGELARSIATLQPVTSARVHLVIPERGLLVQNPRPASASVTVNVRGSLTAENIAAIRHLVSAAVADLAPDAVAVVDQKGRLLARAGSGAVGGGGDGGDLDSRAAATAARMRAEIEAMLAPIVGADKVRAEVSVELDRDQRREEVREYDPDRQVIARQTSVESANRQQSSDTAGAAAVSEQLPGGAPAVAGGGGALTTGNETSEEITYENSRADRTIITVPGGVKRLTVAVMVDSGGKPMPAAQVERLRRLVENAVGYDEARGDNVAVEPLAFVRPTAAADPGTDWLAALPLGGLLDLAKLALVAAAGIYALRLIRRGPGERGTPAPMDPAALPGPAAADEAGSAGTAPPPGMIAANPLPSLIASGPTSLARLEEEIAAAGAEGGIKAASLARLGGAIAANPIESTAVIRKWMNQ